MNKYILDCPSYLFLSRNGTAEDCISAPSVDSP